MPAQHQQIRAIFDAATALPPRERDDYVIQACNGDETLYSDVCCLLRRDEQSWQALDARDGAIKLDPKALFDRQGMPDSSPDAVAADAPPLPERIGGFRILNELGSGGAGVVFRAEQQSPRRIVALKTIRTAVTSARTRQRFRAEAEILARLRHPGIAHVYESGVTSTQMGDVPYLVMELVEGRPLLEAARQGCLGIRDLLVLMIRIADAVAFAHQRGVIHRDLKPANILAEPGPSGELQPKILDFGIARLLDNSEAIELPATIAGELLGTPSYMSPEQLRGLPEDVDTRTDVYSLGLILFELLTDRPAFPAETRTRVSHRLRDVNITPPRLGSLRCELRGDIETIVAKATETDQHARYQSVSEFSQDIQRLLNGFPILARRPGPFYVSARFVGRHRVATFAALALFLASVAGGMSVWTARAERLDLAINLASAGLEEGLRMQRTIGESSKRGPMLELLHSQVEALSALAPQDTRVMSLRAAVLTERGYVALNEARHGVASICFDEALRLQHALVQVEPSLERRLELARAIVRVGDAAGVAGDDAARAACYNEALQIQESLAAEAPDDLRVAGALGWSYERLAGLIDSSGPRATERIPLLTKQAEVFERFGEAATVDERRGLSVAYANLAMMSLSAGRDTDARDFASRAMHHAQTAVAQSPTNRYALVALTWAELAHNRALAAGVAARDHSTAMEKTVQRASRLLALDEWDQESRCGLISALYFAGLQACETGDLLRARGYKQLEEWHSHKLTTPAR